MERELTETRTAGCKGKYRILRERTLSCSQKGQSLLEFALVTPILLLLSIGVIELGRYAYISILVGNAARAGAAYGSESLTRSADTSGITTAANNDFLNNGQTGLSVSSVDSCGCDNGGTITSADCSPVTNPNAGICTSGHWVVVANVTASGTFSSLFNYPGIPTSLSVSKTSSMRVQQQ
jgi:Flp pilus assembly protein TadG